MVRQEGKKDKQEKKNRKKKTRRIALEKWLDSGKEAAKEWW